MVSTMNAKLDEEALRDILVAKLTGSIALKEDVAYYYRLPLGAADRSYDFLINCLDRSIDRAQTDKNRIDQAKAYQNAVPGKGKGKGKNGDPPKKEEKGKKPLCYFHNNGGCSKSAKDCDFDHRKATKAEIAALVRPERRSSSKPRKGNGKGKEIIWE